MFHIQLFYNRNNKRTYFYVESAIVFWSSFCSQHWYHFDVIFFYPPSPIWKMWKMPGGLWIVFLADVMLVAVLYNVDQKGDPFCSIWIVNWRWLYAICQTLLEFIGLGLNRAGMVYSLDSSVLLFIKKGKMFYFFYFF